MTKKTASRQQTRTYTEQQLAGLRVSTTAKKQETVDRLRLAIQVLTAKKQPISGRTIYAESGLLYASIVRNPEALALFRANSTHLSEKRKQHKRKQVVEDTSVSRRDTLLNYKKPQLVTRLRTAIQRIQELEQQQAILLAAALEHEAHVAALEAKIAELEPYRQFIEQVRTRVRKGEHGDGAALE
jgi:isocitrate lyase